MRWSRILLLNKCLGNSADDLFVDGQVILSKFKWPRNLKDLSPLWITWWVGFFFAPLSEQVFWSSSNWSPACEFCKHMLFGIFSTFTRWWFQYFHVHPYLGKIPILTNIFQLGWNHHLVYIEHHKPIWFLHLQFWKWNSTQFSWRISLGWSLFLRHL